LFEDWLSPAAELDIDDPIEAAAARRREYNVRLSAERIRDEHTFSRIKHT
jgi:hypothetical protein